MYQKEIKKNNENIIFEYIYNQKQGFSIAEIAETFHLSFPTVKRIFQNFLERGILIESQKIGNGVGRKAMEYLYNENFCYSVGMRILEEGFHFVLINSVGKVFLSQKKWIDSSDENIIDTFLESLLIFLKEIPENKKSLLMGVGIAIPGIFNQEARFIEFTVNHFSSFSLLQKLQEQIPFSLYIENESNLSAIAEAILGNYLNLSEFTVLTVNKNVGSSHFVRRDKYGSFYFKAGRLHHMTVQRNGRKCYCGSRGCLGSYISMKALLQEFQEKYPDVKKIEDIFEKKYHSSPIGEKIINEYLDYLAAGIRNLLFFSNPEKVIITGSICSFQDYLYSKLLNKIYHKDHIFFRGRDTVVFSSFQENSSLIGAALFPIVDSMF